MKSLTYHEKTSANASGTLCYEPKQLLQTMRLRPYSENDLDAVLELNEASVEVLSPLDADRLRLLISLSEMSLVAEIDNNVAGFMLVFAEASDYDGESYGWFDQNYDNFLYVDRIIIAAAARGQGLASIFYQQLIDDARKLQKNCLLAEIDIEPPNHASLKFHQRFGFVEVDRLTYAKGKQVSQQRLILE